MADVKLVIKINEDVYTRLFDNGIQDNEIAVDDVCEMARALRLGTPLNEVLDEIRAEIDEQIDLHDTPLEVDEGMDASFCDGLSKAKEIIDKCRKEQE